MFTMSDKPETEQEERTKLYQLIGDAEAVDMLMVLAEASQIADDLYDDDKSINVKDSVTDLLTAILCELPQNPFYMQHYARLTPLIRQCVYGWQASNDMANNGRMINRRKHVIAYTTRDLLCSTIIECIAITKGAGVAGCQAAGVWTAFTSHDYDDWFRAAVKSPDELRAMFHRDLSKLCYGRPVEFIAVALYIHNEGVSKPVDDLMKWFEVHCWGKTVQAVFAEFIRIPAKFIGDIENGNLEIKQAGGNNGSK